MPEFPASLTERVIYLDSPISDDSARLVMESLLFFDLHQRGRPITLLIDSPGGKVYPGLAIYDVMRCVTSPLVTVGVNEVGGLAVLLLAAGDRESRYLMPGCQVIAGGVSAQLASAEAIISHEVKRLSEAVAVCFADATANLYIEHFLPPGRSVQREQAIGLGLADAVLDIEPPEYFRYRGGASGL